MKTLGAAQNMVGTIRSAFPAAHVTQHWVGRPLGYRVVVVLDGWRFVVDQADEWPAVRNRLRAIAAHLPHDRPQLPADRPQLQLPLPIAAAQEAAS